MGELVTVEMTWPSKAPGAVRALQTALPIALVLHSARDFRRKEAYIVSSRRHRSMQGVASINWTLPIGIEHQEGRKHSGETRGRYSGGWD